MTVLQSFFCILWLVSTLLISYLTFLTFWKVFLGEITLALLIVALVDLGVTIFLFRRFYRKTSYLYFRK